MEKVVKCINSYCGQYFMYTEKDTKCPFCYTVYVDGGKNNTPHLHIGGLDKEKKEPPKTLKKESFKVWKN